MLLAIHAYGDVSSGVASDPRCQLELKGREIADMLAQAKPVDPDLGGAVDAAEAEEEALARAGLRETNWPLIPGFALIVVEELGAVMAVALGLPGAGDHDGVRERDLLGEPLLAQARVLGIKLEIPFPVE